MLQMANMNTSNTAVNTAELEDGVREFLGENYVNLNSPAGKLISAFDERAKLVKKAVPLTGATTYPVKEVLTSHKEASCLEWTRITISFHLGPAVFALEQREHL